MRPTGLTILLLLAAACGDDPVPAPLSREAAIDLLLSPADSSERAEALIPALLNEDPVVAAAARAGLAAMGRDAVPGLVRAIRTDWLLIHPGDRRALSVAAGRILMETAPGRDFGLLNVLIEHITDEDFRLEEFLLLFTEAGDPDLAEAVAELAALLTHRNCRLRKFAAAALWRLGPSASAAVPDLVATLPDGMKKGLRTQIVCTAAGALASIGVATDEVVTALELLLTSPESWVVDAARDALRELGRIPPDPAALPEMSLDEAMAGFHGHEDWADARVTVAAIGESAAPRLIDFLDTGSPDEREAAAEALGIIGPGARAAVPALTGALAAEERWVRLKAIEALGWIGPAAEPAVPSLILLVEGDDAEARSLAAAALAGIGPGAADAVPVLRRAVLAHDRDLELVTAALRAIAVVGR